FWGKLSVKSITKNNVYTDFFDLLVILRLTGDSCSLQNLSWVKKERLWVMRILTTKTLAGLVITGMALVMVPFNLSADNGVTTARLFGTDRIGTAVVVSSTGWMTADTAILAPAADANLVDALAAAPLAGKASPILLTEKDNLNSTTKAELQRLRVTKVFAVGAINQTVVDQLNAIGGITVTVLKGEDRTATAAAIAAKLINPAGSFVVGYGALADALSVASYAAANNYSILVANPDGSLPASEAAFKGANVNIIGGPSLVDDIAGATRHYGTDRFATNKAVLNALVYNYDKVYVANGTDAHLVDSLIASSLAAKSGAPIVLCDAGGAAAASDVQAKLAANAVVTALGGSTIVSENVLNEVAHKITENHAISIKDFTFTPAVLTVSAGSTVVWTNNDSTTHNIKSSDFNSTDLAPGDTFEFKFEKTGTYNYSCGIHPAMTGQIIVK
ncbi:MAG TPA: cell wall-binding repeat-containing protein, partial [Desulfitobacteriaceae bacterium]|nr:cell wall-binding repeat-containing protein [Desulfitobacteriaceae bacterium]